MHFVPVGQWSSGYSLGFVIRRYRLQTWRSLTFCPDQGFIWVSSPPAQRKVLKQQGTAVFCYSELNNVDSYIASLNIPVIKYIYIYIYSAYTELSSDTFVQNFERLGVFQFKILWRMSAIINRQVCGGLHSEIWRHVVCWINRDIGRTYRLYHQGRRIMDDKDQREGRLEFNDTQWRIQSDVSIFAARRLPWWNPSYLYWGYVVRAILILTPFGASWREAVHQLGWLVTGLYSIPGKFTRDLWFISDPGPCFVRVFRVVLPILIPSNAPYWSMTWCWYNRPISGRRQKLALTQSLSTDFKNL
jgi:hypothetical protein